MKYHVRKGTGNNCDSIPLCAFNARRYKHLPGYVLSPKDFRNHSVNDRCQHCERGYLVVRNRQRATKGLPPVSAAFEGLD